MTIVNNKLDKIYDHDRSAQYYRRLSYEFYKDVCKICEAAGLYRRHKPEKVHKWWTPDPLKLQEYWRTEVGVKHDCNTNMTESDCVSMGYSHPIVKLFDTVSHENESWVLINDGHDKEHWNLDDDTIVAFYPNTGELDFWIGDDMLWEYYDDEFNTVRQNQYPSVEKLEDRQNKWLWGIDCDKNELTYNGLSGYAGVQTIERLNTDKAFRQQCLDTIAKHIKKVQRKYIEHQKAERQKEIRECCSLFVV